MVALSAQVVETLSAFTKSAQALYDAGYTPVPIMPRSKVPGEYKGGHWTTLSGWNAFATERPDSATLAKWMTWPNAGIGVVLGTQVGGYQLIAIDFDTDVQDEIELLQSQLPPSPMRKRGQRGYTAFFRAALDVKTKRYMVADPTSVTPNKKRTLLEILTGNAPRQTVMPPSMHPCGHEYEWDTQFGILPIAQLPVLTADHFEQLEDTLEHLGWNRAEAQPRTHANDNEADGDGSEKNIWREVNDLALHNLDMWVPHLGLPKLRKKPNGAWEAVPFWRPSNTGQPLEKRKANLKMHSTGIKDMGTDVGYTALDVIQTVFAWGLDESFAWLSQKLGLDTGADMNVTAPLMLARDEAGNLYDTATGEIVKVASQPAESEEIESVEVVQSPIAQRQTPAVPSNDNAPASLDEMPDHLTRPPGLLGDVAKWVYDSARSPSHTLALATALVALGTLSGRRDAGPTDSCTALYILCVMPSGGGKQHGLNCLKRLLRAAGAGEHIGSPEFKSDASIITELTERPLQACPMDEFGTYLKMLSSRKAASHQQNIVRTLRTAFSAQFESMETPSLANARSRSIFAPSLSILGMSTPQQFYGALSGADVEDGTLNRFLVLRSKTRPAKRDPVGSTDVPSDLGERLSALYEARGRSANRSSSLQPGFEPIEKQPIMWGEGAKQVFDEFERKIERLCDDHPEVQDFYARAVELSIRLATIVAVGRKLNEPSVSIEDMNWACELAFWANQRMATDAARYSSETEAGGRWSKILVKLEQAKGGSMSYAALNASLRFSQRDMEEALKAMEDAQLIRRGTEPRSDGKAGRPARWVWLV